MKATIGAKLGTLFGTIMLLFIGLSVYIRADLTSFNNRISDFQNVHNETKAAQVLQHQVLNVWQFMTDASLRKDRNVIQKEALPSLEKARAILKELGKFTDGKPEKAQKLKKLEGEIEVLWSTGNRMFDAYSTDPQKGHEAMERYDRISSSLIKDVDDILEEIQKNEDGISSYLYKNIKSSHWVVSVILVVGLIVGAGVIFFLRLLQISIVKPIHNIKEASIRIAAGDLSFDVSALGAKGEVGELSEVFEVMVWNLRGIIKEVKNGAEQLSSATSALNEISQQIVDGFKQQDVKATQVATASQELSATFVDVANNTLNAAESAKEACAVASKGGEIVDRSIKSINSIALTTKETANLITVLGKRSEEVGAIIKVIDDIASQTNLLALNAAIEAARAGEQGRGFAVVADEVRKLAEKTGQATKEISEMIAAIQTDTEKALEGMKKETISVESGVTDAREAGSALGDIVGRVDQVTSMIQQIAAATEEQSTAAEQISADIESVSRISTESAMFAEQIVFACNAISDLGSHMKTTTEKFTISQ